MNWILHVPNGTHYAILALMVACVLPFVFAFLAKMAGGFDFKSDNQNPRAFLAQTTGLSARLNAVQANSFESLPIFIGAVLVAMYCFVPQNVVNGMAWLYVVLRLIYGVAYAMNLATFRSVIWGLSLVCCLQLFYFAIKMIW
ncbi:MAPEG family protein [Moraxella bovis]|uniref:MAPEG family protein n=1 Tax=Moraxella bovis TaxID=476 RepID=UPI0022277196|nr:MAPEG family protein [Moraxella bovis]UYZ68343.1 MAPEG family protein [Moraxella bovis]UYZ70717.1 MAPEG family protein [Moraxella bovis]UYZ73351.1 MAPEG family protein [Moraxella bovis]UYZ81377.1 MAPEG family protein [Moraxella bovis]UZA06060.1 MAPEG family protein [Moraxella bovis]